MLQNQTIAWHQFNFLFFNKETVWKPAKKNRGRKSNCSVWNLGVSINKQASQSDPKKRPKLSTADRKLWYLHVWNKLDKITSFVNKFTNHNNTATCNNAKIILHNFTNPAKFNLLVWFFLNIFVYLTWRSKSIYFQNETAIFDQV